MICSKFRLFLIYSLYLSTLQIYAQNVPTDDLIKFIESVLEKQGINDKLKRESINISSTIIKQFYFQILKYILPTRERANNGFTYLLNFLLNLLRVH